MNINFTQRLSPDKTKIFYADGMGPLMILEMKRSQMILDSQAISSGYIPQHKIKSNFLDYYAEFVKLNSRKGNRHLSQSLGALRSFIGKNYISAI